MKTPSAGVCFGCGFAWLALSVVFAPVPYASAAEKVDFSRDIQPILSAKCYECHGPDESTRKAKLRFDDRGNATADRDGTTAIVPGHPDKSELIARITITDEDDRMPPHQKGERLSPREIKLLRDWIAEGAEYAEHWAFIPPKRPAVPRVKNVKWANNAVDRFVLQKLEKEGLPPAGRASREALIRRATLDLIGLPPTPKEIDEFLADQSPKAWERLIDRLLASPHYGERWGRHWLDVARYADSGGFETDIFFGHAWRYRDYVIRSFNADKPFNQFIKEQIAGDELFPGNKEAWLATGLYTTGPVLQEAGMVKGKLEYDQLTDAVDTTGSAFLGLTMGCARCHDHKYDPLAQKEYFAMQAVFAASDQFDFKEDGQKMRGRAALKKTQDEFELEQMRARAKREAGSAAHTENLRKLGDYYVRLDKDLNERVEQSRLYASLQKVVGQYRVALTNGGVVTNTVLELADNSVRDDEDNVNDADAAADMAALASLATLKGGAQDRLDGLLIEIGRRALEMAGRGNEPRRTFRQLKTDEEKRAFLLDYGKQSVDLPPPDGFVDNAEQLRLELGRKHLNDDSQIPVRVLAHQDQPWEVRLLKRGELEMPGDVVAPGVPARLGMPALTNGLPPEKRRAALAEWIASEKSPLTARTIVNRIWQWHFGQGIVRTPNDLGVRGERPTHPELLDWLAVEFVEHGWSIKHLHRVIMLSSAYQMASTPGSAGVSPASLAIQNDETRRRDAGAPGAILARDPENRLLTRFQPYRLQAEVIWDNLRAVAGTLNTEMYGLPFAPPLDEQEMIGNFRKWPTSTPEESDRRAIYILTKRSFRFPTLSAFDLPDNISSCGQRDITTIPNQALTLLNNYTIQQQAEAFAKRLLRETNGDPGALVALAWRYAYGRNITGAERQQAVEFIQSRSQTASAKGMAARPAVEELCLALFNTNEFIYMQ